MYKWHTEQRRIRHVRGKRTFTMFIRNEHTKWSYKMNIKNEHYIWIIFYVHYKWSFLMFILYDHFIWSFFMFVFYDHFLWSFISLSLRLPYSVCGRVCVWWGVAGKALILRNKRKYKIRQHKRWQDKTEQGTRRLDRSTHDQNVPCFMSLWCMTKSQEFKGRRLAKGTR